jgi:hypothetical protein
MLLVLASLKQAKITEENKAMEVISASIEQYKD